MDSPDAIAVTAVVAAGDEETRILLRGLLRLHHLRVVGEAEGMTQALNLVRAHHPRILVADANLAEGTTEGLLRALGDIEGRPRSIVVVPPILPLPGHPAPDAVLHRPFRIREFAEALGAEAAPPASPS